MHTFFLNLDISYTKGAPIIITEKTDPELLHHTKVRRIEKDEKCFLLNGKGGRLEVSCTLATKKEIHFTVLHHTQVAPKTPLHLWIAPIEIHALETVFNQCTQVGVTDFHFFSSERSQQGVYLTSPHKQERFVRIIKEACAQSEQYHIPHIHWDVQPLRQIIETSDPNHKHIVAIERINDTNKYIYPQQPPESITTHIYIGPEGGWTKKETDLISQPPLLSYHLQHTGILRAETAALLLSGLAREHLI